MRMGVMALGSHLSTPRVDTHAYLRKDCSDDHDWGNLRVLWVPSQPAVLRWQVSTHIKLARREEFNAYLHVE
jgi:hypothetical protein